MHRSFHHQGIGHGLTSSQNNSHTAVPVFHPPHANQVNMVANRFPEELRVTYCPGQRQQGYAQRQHFHNFHHRQTSQPSIQNPQPRDNAHAPRHSYHMNCRNNVLQFKCLETSANKNSLSVSAGTSSSALKVLSPGQEMQSSNPQRTNPLLYALLRKDSSDQSLKQSQEPKMQKLDRSGGSYFTAHHPVLGGLLPRGPPTDDQIREYIDRMIACDKTVPTSQSTAYSYMHSNELNSCTNNRKSSVQVQQSNRTSGSGPDCREWQRGSSAVMQQYTATGRQALNANLAPSPKSSETGSTVPSKTPSGTPASPLEPSKPAPEKGAVDSGFPVEKHLEMCGKHVYDDCGDKPLTGSNDENVESEMCDKYVEGGVATLHYSLTALKELIASLEKVDVVEKENVSNVLLQQFWDGNIDNVHVFTSTEYPQILVNAASTCTKNEDESPVVLSAVSGLTLDKSSDNNHSLIGCTSSLEQYKSCWLNLNDRLDDVDKVPGVCWALKARTVQKEGSPKPKDAGGLDNEQCMAEFPKKIPGSSCSVPSENRLEHVSLLKNQDANTEVDKDIKDPQQNRVTCGEEPEPAAPDSSIQILGVVSRPPSQNEHSNQDGSCVKIRKPPSFSKNKTEHSVNSLLKDPQYEDISEDEAGVLPQLEHVRYEDISDDDCPQVFPKDKTIGSALERENCGQVVDQTEGIADDEGNPETAVQRDEMGDDWSVIHLIIEDLQLEPEQEAQDDVEVRVQEPTFTERLGDSSCCRSLQPALEPEPPPEPAAVPSHIEVFDTIECFRQAKAAQFMPKASTSITEGLPKLPGSSDPESSSDTEDSCDYSSASEHNYLTVTRQLLEQTSAPMSPETNLSVKEKSHPRGSRLQRLKELVAAKAQSNKRRRIFDKADEVITIHSDSDDEQTQIFRMTAKRNRLFSSSRDDGEPSCRQQGPMETDCSVFESSKGEKTQPAAEIPKLDEPQVEGTELVKHVTNSPNIITIDSDTEDELDQKAERSDTPVDGWILHEASRQTTRVSSDPDQVVKRHMASSDSCSAVERRASPKRVQPPNRPAGEKPSKPTVPTKVPPQLLPQAEHRSSSPNPVIPRLFVQQTSPPSSRLQLAKEFKGRPGKVKSRSAKAVSKDLLKNPGQSGKGRRCEANITVQGPGTKARPAPGHGGSSSSTNGQLPKARQSLPSSGLSPSAERPASSGPGMLVPRTLSSSRPNLNTSKDHLSAPAKGPPSTAAIPLAKQQVISAWSQSHVPIRRDRKHSLEEHLKAASSDSSRKARPGPSYRRRHSSNEAVTPLMKKAKLVAIQRTKDINPSRDQSVFKTDFLDSNK